MRNRQGSALLLVLAATALAGILIVVVSKIIDTQNKESQINQLRNMRDTIAMRALNALTAPGTLRHSAAQDLEGNRRLARCLRMPGVPGDCPDGANEWTSFRALAQHGSTSTPASTAIAGRSNAPVRYSLRGFAGCAAASPRCPFEVVAEFHPLCPDGNCTATVPAEAIEVRVQVALASGINPIPSMPNFQMRARTFPDATDPNYIPERDRKLVSRSEIMGLSAVQNCPGGSRQVGVYEDGQINCECFGHLEEILPRDPITRKPKCATEGERCGPGTALRGFEANGAPICEVVIDGYECDVTVAVNANGHADCGPKYRLRAITDPGNCYVEPTNPGGDDDDGIVRCPGISIHCCRLKVANE